MTEARRAEVLKLAKGAQISANPLYLELSAAVIEMAAELERGKEMFVKELAPQQMALEGQLAEARRVIEDAHIWLRPFNAWIERAMRFLEATKK